MEQRNRMAAFAGSLAPAPLHVLALLPLASATDLDRTGLFLACAAFLVVFGFVLHAVESRFYFTGEAAVPGRAWAGGIGLFLALAAVVALVAPRGPGDARDLAAAVRHWAAGEPRGAFLPVALSTVAFMVLYCVIGSLTWPFVRRHYEGPGATLSLRVPSGPVVVGLQLGRGLAATVALLPLLAGLDEGIRGPVAWGLLVLPLGATFAVAPMIQAPRDWPLSLRLKHGVEILVFVALQAFAWWRFVVA